MFVGVASILLILGTISANVGYDVGFGVGLPAMGAGEGRAVGNAVGDRSSIEGKLTLMFVSPVYAFKLEVKFDEEVAVTRALISAEEF
jgi:hypothetical protein